MADRKSDEKNEEKPRLPEEQRLPRSSRTPDTPIENERQRQVQISNQWILPTTGNPDLDPACLNQSQRIDLRETNPLVPRGMFFDPRQLQPDQQSCQNQGSKQLPPQGARFDPFGPPDVNQVGPGRGQIPSSQFGNPDPDHMPPPGQQQQPPPGRQQKPPPSNLRYRGDKNN